MVESEQHLQGLTDWKKWQRVAWCDMDEREDGEGPGIRGGIWQHGLYYLGSQPARTMISVWQLARELGWTDMSLLEGSSCTDRRLGRNTSDTPLTGVRAATMKVFAYLVQKPTYRVALQGYESLQLPNLTSINALWMD